MYMYAIPLALSVVHRRHVASVFTITTRNNEAIKSIFSANVYHISGLCLLGIGGTPYISHVYYSLVILWLKNHQFSTSSLKLPSDGTSYYARRLPKPRPS